MVDLHSVNIDWRAAIFTAGQALFAAELLSRGWTEEDCARLAGGNVLRVLRDAEAAARELARRHPPSTARIEDLDG